MTKEALKLALEALETLMIERGSIYDKAITAIKEALANDTSQERVDKTSGNVHEPVAFENWHKANYVQNLERYGDTYKNNHVRCRHQGWLGAQSSSPQRTWVGLTYQERCELWNISSKFSPDSVIMHDFAKDIELALREKNYDRND